LVFDFGRNAATASAAPSDDLGFRFHVCLLWWRAT
jgi:hypothetical protein